MCLKNWISHGYPMVSQIHWLIIIFSVFLNGKCPSSPLARRCVHQPSWKKTVAPAGIRWMVMFWERFKRETLGIIWCNTPNSTNIREFLLGVYCLLFWGGFYAQGPWFMRLRILRMVTAMAPYPQSIPTRGKNRPSTDFLHTRTMQHTERNCTSWLYTFGTLT